MVAIVAVVVEAVAGSSSGSSKSDYDKFQSCLSDDATGGSATKQQIKDCFSSTYGGGSRNSGRQRQEEQAAILTTIPAERYR